jgi:hypothetical protein
MKMRSSVTQVVGPFTLPPSPETYKLYAQGIMGVQNDIRNLNENWKNPEIQDLFNHTSKSYSANTDLSASASIPVYGWIERELRERKSKKSSRSENTDEISTVFTDEDVSRIIADFRTTYPNIKLDLQDDNRTISVRCFSYPQRVLSNKAHRPTLYLILSHYDFALPSNA